VYHYHFQRICSFFPILRYVNVLNNNNYYYYYNGAQWYKQFLQVDRLDRALILLGLALCLPSTSVSLVFMVLYTFNIFVTFFSF